MPRSTNAPASRARRKKYLKLASGFRGSKHRLYKTARQAAEHAGAHAYAGRRVRRRDFRMLWIARINAATRACGISYSRFMRGLKLANIEINRKMLAEIAATDEVAFGQLVEQARKSLEATAQRCRFSKGLKTRPASAAGIPEQAACGP